MPLRRKLYPSGVVLSVIVVSYNTRELLRRCLESLGTDDEILVVDNASTDSSADMVAADFPHCILIQSEVNLGFGAAANLAMSRATGELLLLLNSDAYATQGAVTRLKNIFKDQDVVACGGRLEFPDGRRQWSASRSLTLWAVFCEQLYLEKLIGTYWVSSSDVIEVAQVMGACLMMRPLEKFDERFFLYCEDTDLCQRLARHGKILYVPDAIFIHELGASSKANRWESIARYNRGKEIYFNIHYGTSAALFCLLINRIGALFRLVFWSAVTILTLFSVDRFRNRVPMFMRVLFAPFKGPPLPLDSKVS